MLFLIDSARFLRRLTMDSRTFGTGCKAGFVVSFFLSFSEWSLVLICKVWRTFWERKNPAVRQVSKKKQATFVVSENFKVNIKR